VLLYEHLPNVTLRLDSGTKTILGPWKGSNFLSEPCLGSLILIWIIPKEYCVPFIKWSSHHFDLLLYKRLQFKEAVSSLFRIVSIFSSPVGFFRKLEVDWENFQVAYEGEWTSYPVLLCPGLSASIVSLVIHIWQSYLTFSYYFIFYRIVCVLEKSPHHPPPPVLLKVWIRHWCVQSVFIPSFIQC